MKMHEVKNKTGSAQKNVDGLLDKKQLAERLNLSVRSVDAWMKTGLLPYIKAGRTVRLEYDTVLAHLRQYQVGGGVL